MVFRLVVCGGGAAPRGRDGRVRLGVGRPGDGVSPWTCAARLRPDYFPAQAPVLRFGVIKPFRAANPDAAAIIRETAERHGVPVTDLFLPGKCADKISRARHEAMFRLNDPLELNLSLPKIGRIFRRDHKTVHHGITQHRLRLERQELGSSGAACAGSGSRPNTPDCGD